MRMRGGLVVVAAAMAMVVMAAPAVAVDAPGPVSIQVVNQAGPAWDYAVTGAIRNWNRNGRITLTQVAECTPGTNCVRFVWGADVDHLGWTDRIDDRTWQVVINATAWADSGSWDPAGTRHLRRALSCHELGHVLLGTPNHLEAGHGCLDVDVLEDRRYAGRILLDAVRTGVLPTGLG